MTGPGEYTAIEDMTFFAKLEEVSDEVFGAVTKWSPLAQETVGKQLVKSFDSLGANLVEGDGRSTQPDALKFFVIARASGRETRYWIKRAAKRELLTPPQAMRFEEAIDHALRATNKLINYRRSVGSRVVRESANRNYASVLDEIASDP
jgi:four helix bundle protein